MSSILKHPINEQEAEDLKRLPVVNAVLFRQSCNVKLQPNHLAIASSKGLPCEDLLRRLANYVNLATGRFAVFGAAGFWNLKSQK